MDTVAAYGQGEAYVRLVVTRGDGEFGVDPFSCDSPRLLCMAGNIQLYPRETMKSGVDMVTVSTRKPPPDVLNREVKSLNYLNSVMAKREARVRGAHEGLVLNLQGTVAEAPAANVYALNGRTLVTPPTLDGALAGITRATVLDIAKELNIPSHVRSIGSAELMRADEVFLTGTGARIVPVGTLDGVRIGNGEWPVACRLSNRFAQMASGIGVVAVQA